MKGFKALEYYQLAFENAMCIFNLSKKFPAEEKFGLTSQIRNSSRAVCSCIAESYRKRQYIKHFLSNTSDADMENSETLVWLDFAFSCGYFDQLEYDQLVERTERIGRILNFAQRYPEKFCTPKRKA